jgi:hypothetical protein
VIRTLSVEERSHNHQAQFFWQLLLHNEFAGAANLAADGAQALLRAWRAYEHGMKAAAVILAELEPSADVALQRLFLMPSRPCHVNKHPAHFRCR